MIHVEATMISREMYAALADFMDKALTGMQRSLSKRREHWSSRTEARTWFSKRAPWCDWDPRVLALFVVSGPLALPRRD
jgi:hypothetical protein